MRWAALVLILVCAGLAQVVAGRLTESLLNPVVEGPLGTLSDEALALHRGSEVADLHADSLLFGRDLLERASRGHLDLPRMLEGGMALQVFSVVSKAPFGYDLERTDGDRPDYVTLLALQQLWPIATYTSLHERVLYQGRRLEDMADRSDGRLRLLRSREDLERLLEARRAGEAAVGALLAIEGSHVLANDFDADLEALFEQGLRMASFTHFFDNDFAGSVNGLEKGGLTSRGRALVAAFERMGIAIDLSHASQATVQDVLAIARKPVVVSHTGVYGTCDRDKNVSDDQIRAIAANGGVIGIGLWDTAVCGTTAADTVRAMRHVIDLVGDAHVGLGSDFDGVILAHFDVTGLPHLTQALLDADLAPDSIRRILGGNVLRVLRATLP
jgi:microsomal dipeptidase-like Zn-dependent dipeptidase